ncbi:branched-chain amino acid transport system II carrier protein [Nosocomiicoccus ampullae]|uniref:branched-chain amino acid transport system II carrier protein n=1 Tax=Nosocomiicoccus ampullae TaxID=489910 RepID=UPI001C5E8C80|nr:branched-chain amino acid transport system II carrier protein [Nosocomiicoccus ampullae]QYA48018.1 branched-chain amino acid transport system II carrier protein [Nosocomiicoccus ampullae]
MEKKIPFFQILAIGFMLFAMFLGAGNVIFAPVLGQLAGDNTPIAMLGFLITGVGLVLLAIIALNKNGGKVENLASKVSDKFSIIFSILLFLSLGPFYVIPRTTSVVYEISLKQLLPEDTNHRVAILLFSIVFMTITIFLSWQTSKFVDRLGKVITPIFLILLIIFVGKSILTPMGGMNEPVIGGGYESTSSAFLKGFTQGYFTMDVLAAFVFGGIFIKSINALNIKKEKDVQSVFFKAGFITLVGLIALQLSMAWIGLSSVDSIGYRENGGEVIALSALALFGEIGIYIIGTVIFLTGVTTNVACLAAVSEYFEQLQPNIDYRKWLLIYGVLGILFTNFGLNSVLSMAAPILMLLYPIAIALIVLVFLEDKIGYHKTVYRGTIIAVGIIAILDALKEANILVDQINNVFGFIPLFESGAGWILPGIIGGIIGYIIAKKTNSNDELSAKTN